MPRGSLPAPSQSAVIVAVPEAEDVVGRFRAELDPSAALGVPAHVTILVPFVAPARIDQDILAALAETMKSVSAFDVIFERVSWFSDAVAWLAPEPAEPFRELTKAVWQRFPDYPPYNGAYEDIVPHLTIGENRPAETMRLAAQAVERLLPIGARISRAMLIQGSNQAKSWRTVTDLPLAG